MVGQDYAVKTQVLAQVRVEVGLVSTFAATGVLLGVVQSTSDPQRVFSLCVALVYERLRWSSRTTLDHLHLRLLLWDLNSAATWGSISPAVLVGKISL